ncbi:hypothetical protein BARBAKC583_1179 [Bartonella bacilliformis KC583]|uniref:Uncharacterized protein n=1 Tax=Bartonella bacilliformis (strain ATCC 35685 / KC583 / Herrer 020/F12,63) TaxID=360095 RepID=A1UTY4_BARBK|nr:hypothetical protein BARBAKC583_1179 [Bartonella bacilliformis KC583]
MFALGNGWVRTLKFLRHHKNLKKIEEKNTILKKVVRCLFLTREAFEKNGTGYAF